jgi:hypothetical protein
LDRVIPFWVGGRSPAYPLTTPCWTRVYPLPSPRGVRVNPRDTTSDTPGTPRSPPGIPQDASRVLSSTPTQARWWIGVGYWVPLALPRRARFGVGVACRRRREPALAPQAFLCVPTGRFRRRLHRVFKPSGTPLSRPRHLGDPRQALSAVLRFVRLEGSIPLPRQPQPRVPRGNSCLTTLTHGYINLFNPSKECGKCPVYFNP